MPAYDRLSGLDASFLASERLETPMHVASLGVLEEEPLFDERGRSRLADVRSLVEVRPDLIPRFRRRPMGVPLGVGHPVWVDDPRFDIAFHVRLTALPVPASAPSTSRSATVSRRSWCPSRSASPIPWRASRRCGPRPRG